MSEGEFRRRIEKETCYNAGIKKWGTVTCEELDKILDETKKEFPNIDEFKYHQGTVLSGQEHLIPHLPINYEKYVADVVEWKKHWFGNAKVP